MREVMRTSEILMISAQVARLLSASEESMVKTDLDIETSRIAFATNLLRLLRNACAGFLMKKLVFSQCNDLLESLAKTICILLDNRASCFVVHEGQKPELLMLRTAIQFAGNAVSGCNSNSQVFWDSLFPSFRLLIIRGDHKLRNYTSMFIYNSLNSVHLDQLVDTESGIQVIALIVQHVVREDCDWSWYVVERLLAHRNFLRACWNSLDVRNREFLLEAMSSRLQCLSSSFNNVIHVDNLQFIAQMFSSREQNLVPTMLCMVLEVLCLATADYVHYGILSDYDHLVESALDELRLNCESKMASVQSVDENISSVGIKRYLVQLIGNLVFRHRPNQDIVRNVGGIPLILTQMRIDDDNPYILQFTVLTIRNLCENNMNNQCVIANMDFEKHLDKAAWLEQFGIDAKQIGDKITALSTDTD